MSIYDVFSGGNRPFDKEEWAAAKQAQRKEAYELIDNTCSEMMASGDSFRQYLDVQGRFDRYSVANAILVSAQMPEATQLKEYSKWKASRAAVRHDLPSGSERLKGGEPIFTDSKYRAAPDFAITHKEDNDTPVQSQSEREKTVAGNEGGSVRTTVGVELPWRQFAADRLATSHSISGCRGQVEMLLSYQPNERRS